MNAVGVTSIYFRRYLLQWIAFRSFLITLVIDKAGIPLLGLALWSAAMPGQSEISRYYIALLVVQLATISFEHHTLSNDIYSGTWSGALLVPSHPLLPVLGQNIALKLLHLVLGVPILIVLIVLSGARFDFEPVALALPALLIAALIRTLFTTTLALTAFWNERAHSTVALGETMVWILGGSAIPISMFPDRFRDVIELLPFRGMLGFPAEVASGSGDLTGFVIQLGWLAIIAVGCRLMWARGVKRFTAVGG